MPNITVPNTQEKQQLRELGMETKDYGIMHRANRTLGLLCYATRDYIWIKTALEGTEGIIRRKPDELEKQIMQENGIPGRYFDVTDRSSDVIQLCFCDTQTYVEIWRGDRKW